MISNTLYTVCGFPWWLRGKESTCQCKRHGFDPSVRKIPWRRKWQPTPIFLPGKSHGQRSLVGYSPWGRKRVRHNFATKQQKNPICVCVCIYIYIYIYTHTHTTHIPILIEGLGHMPKCLQWLSQMIGL